MTDTLCEVACNALPEDELWSGEDDGLPSAKESADCTREALVYVAGYVANQFKQDHPELGGKESIKCPSEVSPWLRCLSRGGLTQPTEEFLEEIKLLENKFQRHCQDNLSRRCGALKAIVDDLVKGSPLPHSVVAKFARTRFFIRIRFERDSYLGAKKKAQKSKRAKTKAAHFAK